VLLTRARHTPHPRNSNSNSNSKKKTRVRHVPHLQNHKFKKI
jgi:hypothetical protein